MSVVKSLHSPRSALVGARWLHGAALRISRPQRRHHSAARCATNSAIGREIRAARRTVHVSLQLECIFFSSSRSCHQGFRYCAYGEMLRRQNGTQRLHSKIIGLCKLLRNADTDDLKLPQKSLQEKFNFFPSFACGPLMPGGESMFWFTMCVLDTSTRRVSKTH